VNTRQLCLRLLGLAVGLTGLAGCVNLVDTDAMRLCRSLIPALDHAATRVKIIESFESRTTSEGTFAIALDYKVLGTKQLNTEPPQRIACTFAIRDWATPQAGIDALDTVHSDASGTLGPLRLQLLKKYWLERGEAAASDPAPYSSPGTLLSVPRPIATTLQTLLSAAPTISIYALLAAAYALVYGLLGRINLAFGELTMLAGYGAFLGSALTLGTTPSLTLAIVFGLVTAIAHGAALGRLIIAPLSRAPGQHMLIATLGLSIVWSEGVRLSQGNGNRWMPPILNRPWALAQSGDLTVTTTPMSFVVVILAGGTAAVLIFAMAKSRFGRHWRAYADDPKAASLMGLSPNSIITTTMLAASTLTGIAGLLTTLYYGGVGFSGGLATGLKALVGAVLGGLATPRSALLGGLILGLAETIWSALFSIEHRDIAIFTLLIAMIILRPEGLFTPRDIMPTATAPRSA
jgi:branched-chain amino acid transport system permease protein